MSFDSTLLKGHDQAFREVRPTEIPGCLEIFSNIYSDARGRFVKTFRNDWFQSQGLRSDFVEQYYSDSHYRVLRGLHFQRPPAHHAKLVYCVRGTVLDAALDLRPHSPSFGMHMLRELSAEGGNILYLPEGVAHGFYVTSESATIVYAVTSVYSPQHDSGVHWASAGIQWPDSNPIVSKRDQELPPFSMAATVFADLNHES
jgi:dTDP-4-dehydrorhamnose 3,5-epimerase